MAGALCAGLLLGADDDLLDKDEKDSPPGKVAAGGDGYKATPEELARTTGGPNGLGVFCDQLEPNGRDWPKVEHIEFSMAVSNLNTAGGNEVLTVHLYSRGRRVTGGYAHTSACNLPQKLHATELTRDAGRLHGKLAIVDFPMPPHLRGWCTIDATIRDGTLSGTYSGDWSRAEGRGRGAGKGPIAGRVVPEAEMKVPERTLEDGASWPMWRGPYGNGTAFKSALPLVFMMDEARFVWKSEAYVTAQADGNYYHAHNSPVVADNLVFVHNTEPDVQPDAPSRGQIGRYGIRPCFWPEAMTRRTAHALFCDDIVSATDARTGECVWRRRWYRVGLNGSEKGKSGMFSTPVYRGGRLYVQGMKGKLYCLNARTGETVWEASSDPAWTQAWEEDRAKFLAKEVNAGHMTGRHTMDLQASMTMAGGVLICCRKEGGALVGIDPSDGRIKWEAHGTRLNYSSPVPWTHKGKEYALSGNALIDPGDGKVLWKVDGDFGAAVTANAEYMMRNHPFALFRITPEKTELAWELKPTEEEKKAWLAAGVGRNPNEFGPYGNVGWSSGNVAEDRVSFFLPARRGASWSVWLDNGVWRTKRYGQEVARELTLIGGSILSGHRILTSMENNGPWSIEWDPADGSLNPAGGILMADGALCTSPAVADGRLFFRGNDGIVCFDLRQTPAPAVTPETGRYEKTITVTAAPAPAIGGVEIRYTLDGGVPTVNSPRYEKPLELSETTAVAMRSFHPFYCASETVRRLLYVGEHKVTPPPSLALPAGKYAKAQEVSMSMPLRFGEIRYTTDGSEPTADSPVYRAPFRLFRSATVKAATFCEYLPRGPVAVAEYMIEPPAFKAAADGRIEFEAEAFFGSDNDSMTQWSVAEERACSAKRCAKANVGAQANYGEGKGPAAVYAIQPAKPGPLYGWVLASGGVCRYGTLDDVVDTVVASREGWQWYKLPKPVDLKSEGAQVFCFWAVRAGSLDKVVLSPDPKFKPIETAGETPDHAGGAAKKPGPSLADIEL